MKRLPRSTAGGVKVLIYSIDNFFGQLGIENGEYGKSTKLNFDEKRKKSKEKKEQRVNIPKFIRYHTQIVQIACGFEHSLFRTIDGKLYSMGNNNFGQLGIGSNVNSRELPTLVRGQILDEGIYNLAAGAYHTLILTSDGNKVYTWGRNDQGQLGNRRKTSCYVPTEITLVFEKEGEFKAEILQAGQNHSGVIFNDGECWTWGGNNFGQLGIGVKERNVPAPQLVEFFQEDVISISCGYTQTLFLTESRKLYICGDNGVDQLGVDTKDDKVYEPFPITSIDEDVDEMRATSFNCALSERGSLYIWGDTPNGLLTTTEKIHGLEGMVRQVAMGDKFITVLDTNNYLYSWGMNDYGQLGIGDFDPQKDACSIDALNDREINSIFAGKNFMMVIGYGVTHNKKENPLLDESGDRSPRIEEKNLIDEGIDELEILREENALLKKLVSCYEKNRQELVKVIGMGVENNPELMGIVPVDLKEGISVKEAYIEDVLGVLNFDVLSTLNRSHFDIYEFEEAEKIEIKIPEKLELYFDENAIRIQKKSVYSRDQNSYRNKTNSGLCSTGNCGHYAVFTDPELQELYLRLKGNKNKVEERIQELSYQVSRGEERKSYYGNDD